MSSRSLSLACSLSLALSPSVAVSPSLACSLAPSLAIPPCGTARSRPLHPRPVLQRPLHPLPVLQRPLAFALTCSVGDLESLVERRWAEPVEDLVDDRDEGVAREGGEVREEAEEDEGAVSDGDDERRPRRRKRLHREAAGGGGGRERGPRTRRRDLERSTEISRRSTEI